MKFNTTGYPELPMKKDVEEIKNGGPKERYYCYQCQRMYYVKRLPCYHFEWQRRNYEKLSKVFSNSPKSV